MTPNDLAGIEPASALAQREGAKYDGEGAVLGRPLLPAHRLEELLAQREQTLGSVAGFSDAVGAEGLVMAGRAREALDVAERVLFALDEDSALAGMLLRVRGVALAQLGALDEAVAALRSSLERATEHDDAFETAQALDALSRLFALGDSDGYYRDRDALLRALGMRRLPQPPLPVLPRAALT